MSSLVRGECEGSLTQESYVSILSQISMFVFTFTWICYGWRDGRADSYVYTILFVGAACFFIACCYWCVTTSFYLSTLLDCGDSLDWKFFSIKCYCLGEFYDVRQHDSSLFYYCYCLYLFYIFEYFSDFALFIAPPLNEHTFTIDSNFPLSLLFFIIIFYCTPFLLSITSLYEWLEVLFFDLLDIFKWSLLASLIKSILTLITFFELLEFKS